MLDYLLYIANHYGVPIMLCELGRLCLSRAGRDFRRRRGWAVP